MSRLLSNRQAVWTAYLFSIKSTTAQKPQAIYDDGLSTVFEVKDKQANVYFLCTEEQPPVPVLLQKQDGEWVALNKALVDLAKSLPTKIGRSFLRDSVAKNIMLSTLRISVINAIRDEHTNS